MTEKTNGRAPQLPLGFVPEPRTVAIDQLLPSRKPPVAVQASKKFEQLLASIEAIGLIEPLTVGPPDASSGQHVLLDGHLRLLAVQILQWTHVPILVATDDEGYTYNARVNRLSTIQETYMLRRAVERGVSSARLAQALSVDVSLIQKKVSQLDGLCPEVLDLLKDQVFATGVGPTLKKMKPTRQIECAELMLAANNFSRSYAQALLLATPAALLVEADKPSKLAGVSKEQMQKMENEMASLRRQYKLVEQTYGQDVLNLVLARGYLAKLLANEAVHRYLRQHHAELLEEFESIVRTESLEA